MTIKDNVKKLESIARAVRRASISQHFVPIFAVCNSLKEQEKYLEKLRRKCDQEGIVLTEVKLLERPPIERLIQVVKEHLVHVFKDGLPQRLGVQITGLELSILLDEDEQAPAVLQILNMNRESYYTELPFPFIFWLPEYAIIKVANAAPDFWSIQVGSTAFCADETPGSLLPESIESGKSLTVWQDKQSQIPVLERLLNTQPSLEVRLELLIKSADAYYYIGKTHHAQQRYELAIKENKKAKGKPQRVAEAYNKLGLIYSDLGTGKNNLEKAVASLQQYLEIAEKEGRTDLVTMAYNHLGLVYDKHREYHHALQAYRQAQDISRKHGHRKLEGDVLGNMGLLYRKQKDYENALNMHQQALTISREMDDIQGEALDLSNIGLIYHEQNQQEKAIDYYNQALLKNRHLGNKLEEMNQLIHLGDSWKALGNFSKALEKYNSAKAIAESININIFTIWDRLAALFGLDALKDPEKEISLLKEAIEKSHQLESTDKELQYWEKLCEIHRKRNEITGKNNCLMQMEVLIKKQIQHLEEEEKIIGCYEKLSKIYDELDKKKELKACKRKLEELNERQIVAWFEPDTVQLEEMVPVMQVGKTYKLNIQVVQTLPKHPLIYQGKIPFFKKLRRLSNIEEPWVIEGRRTSMERAAAIIPKKEEGEVSREQAVLFKDNKVVKPIRTPGRENYEILLDKRGKASKVRALTPIYNSDSFGTAVSFHFKSHEINFEPSKIDLLLSESNITDLGILSFTPKSSGEERISVKVQVGEFKYKNNFNIPLRIRLRDRRTKQYELTIEDLDRELIARGAQIPIDELFKFNDTEGTPARRDIMERVRHLYSTYSSSRNPGLSSIDTRELFRLLIHKTRQIEENRKRGIWYEDHRMDAFGITDQRVKRNIDCVAAIMSKRDLIDEKNGYSTIKVKNYGEVFNLSENEAFREQPITAGRMYSGFLVKKDVIATAAHCLYEGTVKDLRIVFGYKMLAPYTPVVTVPNENIYKGVNIISRSYIPRGSGVDWALLQLDREVEVRETVVLSDMIELDQPIYVIGHPVGLPVKYAPGAKVHGIEDDFFAADLDVYMSSAGSPVFNSDTHEVIGIVEYGDTKDFRWTGNGWASVIYPRRPIYPTSRRCSRVSKFIV